MRSMEKDLGSVKKGMRSSEKDLRSMKKDMRRWEKYRRGMLAAMVLAMATCLLGGCAVSRLNYIYQNGESYTAGDRVISDKIESIDIDYMSGGVKLLGTSETSVEIRETSEKKLRVHTWVDGTTLYVRYCASAKGLDLNNLKKSLVIELPESVDLAKVKLEVSSAEVTCENFEAQSVDVSSSSGDIKVDCSAKKIKLHASSGEISLLQHGESDEISVDASSGKISLEAEKVERLTIGASSGSITVNADAIKSFKAESSSGDCSFRFANTPESMDVSASSGNVTAYLPEKADLTADVTISSGKFFYELPFSKTGDLYVCGSGANKLKVHTSLGDINLKMIKAE